MLPVCCRRLQNWRLSIDVSIYFRLHVKNWGTEVGLGKNRKWHSARASVLRLWVHQPSFYAELLKRKILKYGVNCWLLNTGWIGGQFGIGKRISIKYTRSLLNAALDGSLLNVKYRKDPVFGFEVPLSCPVFPRHFKSRGFLAEQEGALKKNIRVLQHVFIETSRSLKPIVRPK